MPGKKLNPFFRLLYRIFPFVAIRQVELAAVPRLETMTRPRTVFRAISCPDFTRGGKAQFEFRVNLVSAGLESNMRVSVRQLKMPRDAARLTKVGLFTGPAPVLDFSPVFSTAGLVVKDLSPIMPVFRGGINLDCRPRAAGFGITPAFFPRIRSSLDQVCSRPIFRKALQLVFFPASFQLDFWRRALLKTRLEPKDLNLLGVFSGLPAAGLDELQYEAESNRLFFTSPAWKKGRVPLTDVAVFRRSGNSRLIVVYTGD